MLQCCHSHPKSSCDVSWKSEKRFLGLLVCKWGLYTCIQPQCLISGGLLLCRTAHKGSPLEVWWLVSWAGFYAWFGVHWCSIRETKRNADLGWHSLSIHSMYPGRVGCRHRLPSPFRNILHLYPRPVLVLDMLLPYNSSLIQCLHNWWHCNNASADIKHRSPFITYFWSYYHNLK